LPPTPTERGRSVARNRAGLNKVMDYWIKPAAIRVGITKPIGWHTFRHTYSNLLRANGEDVKTVQELLRHSSAKMTLDVYSQAITQDKRDAQSRVVRMIAPAPCPCPLSLGT